MTLFSRVRWRSAAATLARAVNTDPHRLRFARRLPLSGGGKNYQLPVAMRTMTGSRITTNRVGKMHTIIGKASLAGRL